MPTGYDEEDEDGYGKIAREDFWTVFSSLFEQKGPVRRQLDSFNEFVQNTMQELVDENSNLTLDQAEQFSGQQTDSISSRTMKSKADGWVVPVFPQEARLRNLTYSAPLYIEMKKGVFSGHQEGGQMVWRTENDSGAEGTKVWIGKVPIMLRSTFCILHGLQYQDLNDLNECPYDSGYFITTGSGKVLIAQERMAANLVYVFAKAQPSPINFLAEIRSAVEKGRKTIGQFQVEIFHCKQELLDREVALDFIGNRGTTTGNAVYAQEIGRRRCSMAKGSGSQKVYFFGYMIHRLLLVALERRELDDRDHFGKKRLDLADPLHANLFRMLFRKLTKDVYRYMQKCTPFGG
ncbi:DNA-dependent RNA polymerase II [Marasmius sp. AFHP31]|nr:DNA-dependent RNA polymerase II [Marasmius sp. AFHP31]